MIIKTTRFFSAALILCFIYTPLAQAGALYKWIGEDGSVHYSAQSPVLSKSQTLQRIHIKNRGSREIMAPDFDSNRNIIAAQANAMMAQEEDRSSVLHTDSDSTQAKRKPTRASDAVTAPNIQVSANHAADHASSSAHQEGSPKTVVDVLTDPVQLQ